MQALVDCWPMMNGPAIGATTSDVGPEAKSSLRDEQQQQPTREVETVAKPELRQEN